MAKARRKKLQLVEVAWVDADHNAGWVNDKQVDDEEELGYAYGLLVHKTAKFVAIAQSVQPQQRRLAWHLSHLGRHGAQDSGHRELRPDGGGMKSLPP